MARLVIKLSNTRTYTVDEFDLGSELNSIIVTDESEIISINPMNSEAVARDAGLHGFTADFNGVHDDSIAGQLRLDSLKTASSSVISIPQQGQRALQGERHMFGNAVVSDIIATVTAGQYHAYSFKASMDAHLNYGKILRNAYLTSATPGVAAPDTGPVTGAEVQLSTVVAPNVLRSFVWLQAFTGTSITLEIESDTTGFPSTVSRITHGPFTIPTAEIKEFVGGITPDDFYRVVTTGTFTSATFIVAASVGHT